MKKSNKADKTFAETGSSSSKLPMEALKFGKQLGIDFKGLEPEAQEIWRQLEYLSTHDPLEYQRFITQQMQAAKEEEEEKKAAAAASAKKGKENKAKAEEKPKNEGGFFRPDACFCIKVATVGGDGLKVREVGSNALPELTLYVNMCSSKVIDEPIDRSGAKVADTNLPVADGLQIPLVVGPLRKVDDQSNAIDVVFHPIVATLCASQRYVRAQITDLALEWVLQEANVQFDKKKWEDVDPSNTIRYKGGLGDDKSVPVLFHVSPDGETSQPLPGAGSTGSSSSSSLFPGGLGGMDSSSSSSASSVPKKVKKTGTATFSTDSLLSSLHQEDEPTITELNLNIPSTSSDISTNAAAAKKAAAASSSSSSSSKTVGIQPVSESLPAAAAAATAAATAAAPAKKKLIIEEVGATHTTSTASLADELDGGFADTSLPPPAPAPAVPSSSSSVSAAESLFAVPRSSGGPLLQEVKTNVKTASSSTGGSATAATASSSTTTTAAETATANSKKKSVSFEGLRGKLAEPHSSGSSSSNNKDSNSNSDGTSTSPLKPPPKETLQDLEAMLNRCDDEFARTAVAEEPDMTNAVASASILSDLAKAFASTDAGLGSLLSETLAQAKKYEPRSTAVAKASPPPPPSSSSSSGHSSSGASAPQSSATVVIDVSHPSVIQAGCTPKEGGVFEIVVEGIKSTTSAADLVLEASAHAIKVKTDIANYALCGELQGKSQVEVVFNLPGQQVNTSAISAGYKKKLGKFTVTVATKSV